jgi:hypothetical protein
VCTVAVLDYVAGHFEPEQSDMISTRFSGPVLWIGKEKIMIESLLPRASSLAGLIERSNSLLASTSASRLGDEKSTGDTDSSRCQTASLIPCVEPLAFCRGSDYVGSEVVKPAPDLRWST